MPPKPRPMATSALLLLFCSAALAATGPTTPTFVLGWGSAGNGTGQFSSPTGVAVDALGNVYVVEQFNHRVQKFDRFGNYVLQWGSNGPGDGEFNQPFSAAVDPSGNVYVADAVNNRIQKFSGSGGYLAKWGSSGTGDGQFSIPTGVAVDAAGNVYVADQSNHRIQKFTASGGYLTKWGSLGTGDGQFSYPTHLAVDATGSVYVTDQVNSRVQKFTSSGTFITKWGSLGTGNGQFNTPIGVTLDATGNVYVTDGSRVQKFTASGEYLTQWGSSGTGDGQFTFAIGLAADAAANLYVSDYYNNRLQKFSGAGAPRLDPPATYMLKWGSLGSGAGQFNGPYLLAVDRANGNVYVPEAINNRVQVFSSSGSYITQWGTPGPGNGQFNFPTGAAVDAAGNVYIADGNNNRIQKFTSSGGYLTQWGGTGSADGQFQLPMGVAIDAAGDVYVVEYNGDRVQKFTNTGGFITKWGGFGSGGGQFFGPYGITIDALGNVFVADGQNHRIQKFSTTGAILGAWGSPGSGEGQFSNAGGIGVDARGCVYATDLGNRRIQKFTNTGQYLTQWGSLGTGNGQFNGPLGLAFDAAGSLYVSDTGNRRIEKFAASPDVALVSDVRNDQGRQAQIRFLRSSADAPGAGVSVQGYEVYRRIDPLPQPSASPMDAQLAGWSYLMTVPAHGESEYNVVVPTLVDATAASLEYTAYKVRAATSDPFMFFDSSAENGFSVDNLSPPAPSPFVAAYAAGATHLQWGVSPASDFATFRLYRGASADFIPSPGNLVAATPDTGYVDVGAASGFYKVSAVDRNGNEGPFALVGPSQTTDSPAAGPFEFALEGARPNPALGGRMLVHFALATHAPATLELFDLAGRRIASRAVGSLGGGHHAVDLMPGRRLPGGVYLIRLAQGADSRVVRAAVLE